MSNIPQLTITAYLGTDYRVFADPPFALRIGVASQALAEFYRQHGTESAAFVTACNPYSREIGEISNAARQAALKNDLAQRGLKFLEGEGKHPNGGWAAEPSVLVPGLDLESAKELGARYEQNAIVWCGADAVPKLVLLR